MRDWLVVSVLFIMLGVLNTVSFLSAREAKREAREVRTTLDRISITSQNRCIIRVILSFPPPVSEEQFDIVLADYDECIRQETLER